MPAHPHRCCILAAKFLCSSFLVVGSKASSCRRENTLLALVDVPARGNKNDVHMNVQRALCELVEWIHMYVLRVYASQPCKPGTCVCVFNPIRDFLLFSFFHIAAAIVSCA